MWYYKRKVIKDVNSFPQSEKLVGFVYKITNITNDKFYIGKKSLFHTRRSKISKKEKIETQTRKTFKTTIKESDWQTYYGSCAELTEDIKKLGKEKFRREVIELCYSKKYLTYSEIYWQMVMDVLRVDSYNGNVVSRFFRKDMQ